LIILLAVDGAFGAYALKYITDSNIFGYVFAVIFIFVSIAIVVKEKGCLAPFREPLYAVV